MSVAMQLIRLSSTLLYICLLVAVSLALQPLPPVDWTRSNNSSFTFVANKQRTIYLHAAVAGIKDIDGLTLIPPTALQFARTFALDLGAIFGGSFWVQLVRFPPKSGIYLGLLKDEDVEFVYQSGENTTEGYQLLVDESTIQILGSGARGMWWGTRTLLQELLLAKDDSKSAIELKTGNIKDAPAFKTRGFMLDAGRKWYDASFLKDLCTYASFFKLSEFHLHASDNYPLNRGHNATWQSVYSQFSFLPSSPTLQGLVQRPNETHSEASFSDIQHHCASRGITVIPEIEAPGHALSITKTHPEFALNTSHDLLNLTFPGTIPFVKYIWAEFLPWFHTKEVHIGADEYDSTLADDYISFVNEMSNFIRSISGKRIRIWGTYEPSRTNLTISKDVITQHWQYGQSDPVLLAAQGYEVINSEDYWAYISLKNDHTPVLPAPYPQSLNISHLIEFGGVKGLQWEPSVYNPTNISEQLEPGEKMNKGAIMAAWNDNGPDATTQLEAYYAIREGIPVVGARSWSGNRGPALETTTLEDSITLLTAAAPSQNLDRQLEGGLFHWKRRPGAKGVVRMGKGSVGMNHTLFLRYSSHFTLSSSDISLILTPEGHFTAITSDGWTYPLRSVAEGATLGEGQPGRIWTNDSSSIHEPVALPKQGELILTTDVDVGMRVWSNGEFVGRFEVFVFGGKNTLFSWSQMALVIPLQELEGGVEEIVVSKGLGKKL